MPGAKGNKGFLGSPGPKGQRGPIGKKLSVLIGTGHVAQKKGILNRNDDITKYVEGPGERILFKHSFPVSGILMQF